MFSKQSAIEKIRQQQDQIDKLKTRSVSSPKFKKWKRDTEVIIENIFGDSGRHLADFSNISYVSMSFSASAERKRYLQGLEEARAILDSFIEEINSFWEESPPIESPDRLALIENLCNRFHLVVKQLRTRHNTRETLTINDEYDVQDLFHALLMINFDDIRPEEWTPSYAGSGSRIDFLIKQDNIVVETKKTRKNLRAKEVGEQLIVDIKRYQSHQNCDTLVCFVYDPDGWIDNPIGIENDLNGKHDELNVVVFISPKGY
jgi:hypothetical protein